MSKTKYTARMIVQIRNVPFKFDRQPQKKSAVGDSSFVLTNFSIEYNSPDIAGPDGINARAYNPILENDGVNVMKKKIKSALVATKQIFVNTIQQT